MNLARQAVKTWPHHQLASREQTNSLRRKWLSRVQEMGPKWHMHPSNYVMRKVPA